MGEIVSALRLCVLHANAAHPRAPCKSGKDYPHPVILAQAGIQ